MRKALMLASAGLIVLAGCSPANDKAEDYSAEAAPAAEAAAETPADAATATARNTTSAAPATPRPAPLAPVAQIAYAYTYALSLPRDRGAEMMSRHELACVSAGPGYCQVMAAQADWTAREPAGGRRGGHLHAQAAPTTALGPASGGVGTGVVVGTGGRYRCLDEPR